MRKFPSDEEIKHFLREGWSIQKKKVKHYIYIVKRKGQEMRSLGKYEKDHWDRILKLEQEFVKSLEEMINSGEEVDTEILRARLRTAAHIRERNADYLRKLEDYRGLLKSIECRYQVDWFCEHWKFRKGHPLLKEQMEYHNLFGSPMEDQIKTYVDINGKEKFIARANSTYCATCTSFKANISNSRSR